MTLTNEYVVCYFCGTTRKEACNTTLEAKQCFYYNEQIQLGKEQEDDQD